MRQNLKNAQRIVIKIGTSSLIYPNGKVNLHAIDQLAFVLSDLKNQGKEIVLVSSGAIGVGMNTLKLDKRPVSIPEQQAVAAIGQLELMNIYTQRFHLYNQTIGQLLLTRDVVEYPKSRTNVKNTLEQLIKMNCIPIVNENDTVAVDELDHQTKFGDNDQLSALVTQLCHADLLIMLSDIDGFYSDNPVKNPQAQLFSEIHEITPASYECSKGTGTKFGTGGMQSKLKAAEKLLANNKQMVLANGNNPLIIFEILSGKAIGTLFVNQAQRL
ncbi:glutamate 5-kinase [Vagococcus entomophilus]|uniref:Glutamate 5-kinase n=1 Tax=Vagococcus entomophilus TaxID=1160095 RepID=A0A430AFY5_9ENTE|nr:glutamate 5-kinase [Vagococcus entomophilus]RSU06624.1 glutamate 5-kinase [Vagococcus entomophilus]